MRSGRSACHCKASGRKISIHAPRGGCDRVFMLVGAKLVISIHAPRGGCDMNGSSGLSIPLQFQSTHPAGGATGRVLPIVTAFLFQSTHPAGGATDGGRQPLQGRRISIHAPRGGCDRKKARPPFPKQNFNPRTPRGVRPPVPMRISPSMVFQSTHPAGGATVPCGIL